MPHKNHIWAVLYGLLLVSFTAYVLLDTFVIARIYTMVPSGPSQSSAAEQDLMIDESPSRQEPSEAQPSGEEQTEACGDAAADEPAVPIITDNSYHDGNISITVTEHREKDTSIYVADVVLSSAGYLKTALAQGSYGRNVTERTSEIAESNEAVLAINGDYYGSQERGYVLRNGIVYRSTASESREDLVIRGDGSFSIIAESEASAEALLADGAQHILSFGPALVIGGEVSVVEGEEVGKAMASNPRTAIGIVDDLHYLFVVSDGRTKESEGLSLYELAEFMHSIGAVTAYNLDGGGSSTMYFNGEVVNNPTTNGRNIRERGVSDIVYIGY